MTKPQLILVGAGGHAAACIDVIEQEGRFQIVGLLGFATEVGKKILGYPVLGADAEISEMVLTYKNALICVGQIRSPDLRMRFYQTLKGAGCNLPVITSPLAYVSRHAEVGEGTIVMHGAIINARASVGRNCIINSKALIEHDVQIGDHCHIATATAINGGVTIGEGTFVGSNSALKQVVTIGRRCVIGMGQTVKADCADTTALPNSDDAK